MSMSIESFLTKLDIDESIFDRENFMDELGKIASREELKEFVELLRRSCTTLRTERISFISDKYPEVIEAIQNLSQVEERFKSTKENLSELGQLIDEIGGDFDNLKSSS